jgi:superfamily I DNA and RNA helicase
VTVEVVRGLVRDSASVAAVVRELVDAVDTGLIYTGYPLLETAEGTTSVDLLLLSPSTGLVAFVVAAGSVGEGARDAEYRDQLREQQDRVYVGLERTLIQDPSLRTGRRLSVEINTVTVLPPGDGDLSLGEDYNTASVENLGQLIGQFTAPNEALQRPLLAAVQRVSTMRPSRRRPTAKTPDSRGSIVKEIEAELANLDAWQNAAAIETPDGPQRIRGLAGSGKTVVLALKAAYLHAKHPEWRIAVTFHTRSLYQQFEALITRFCYAQMGEGPDFSRLQIMHAWGSGSQAGVYATLSESVGFPVRDFNYGKSRFGWDSAFRGVCQELLEAVPHGVEPVFDVVLVDEAQDLPPPFFELLVRFVAPPHRIVWAYDELQKLDEAAMPSLEEQFGSEATEGPSPVIDLSWQSDEARRDIVLPVSYRNPPWTLAAAHALGIGVYRDDYLVQHFDSPNLWSDVGYEVVAGDLALGAPVDLRRREASTPEFFQRLLTPADAISFQLFQTEFEQDRWIASEIATNVGEDELEPSDILIVLPDPRVAKSRAQSIQRQLSKHKLDSHVVGVSWTGDEVFKPESVALAHIYRAKGNEAPMVYVVDADHYAGATGAISKRNGLFTAITRSRAWVRVTGLESGASDLQQEFEAVVSNNFHLRFRIPTRGEIDELRQIHRDRTEEEARLQKGLEDALRGLASGEVDPRLLPSDLRERLSDLLREPDPET